MTQSEIAKFQSFLSVLDLQDKFYVMYNRHHSHSCYRMTPEGAKPSLLVWEPMKDYDDFLRSVCAPDVFTAGFKRHIELAEWQGDINQLWLEELKKETPQNTTAAETKAEVADIREGENIYSLASGYKFCPSCYKLKRVSEFVSNANTPDHLWNYCKACSSDENHTIEMSAHHAVYSQNRIFFSPELAADIKAKGLNSASVVKRKGHLFLSFAKKTKNRNLKWYKRNDGFSVSDLTVSKAVCSFFKVTVEDAFYLHISRNTSKKSDMVTVEVMKMYSTEDMKNIKFVKRDTLAKEGLVTKKEEPEKKGYTLPTKKEKFADFFEQVCDDLDISCLDMSAFCLCYLKEKQSHEPSNDLELLFKECAFLLKDAGWKLQQPVKVVKYEEF